MSDIPKARKKLMKIAANLRSLKFNKIATEIDDIVSKDLFRRRAVRRMPRKSNPVTSDIKKEIIDLVDTTDLHNSEIASKVGVNPGRVSEVLHGDK